MREMRVRIACLSAALLTLAAASAASLDLGAQFWTGNLGFRTDRASTDTTFPGIDYFWGFSLYGTQPISDDIRFETGFYSDPILRNISYTLFRYDQKILSVGVGPFFGFFNDSGTLLKSGISTVVKLELPGVTFISFRSDSSIGGELVEKGNYLQERNDITFGFYVWNAICSLSLESRKFEQKTTAAEVVVDSLTEYRFTADIFQKTMPYRLIVTIGLQSLSKSSIAATTTTATLNSIVIGTQLDLTLAESFLLQTGILGSVYSFGQGSLLGSAQDFLFHAYAGVKLNVDTVPFIANRL